MSEREREVTLHQVRYLKTQWKPVTLDLVSCIAIITSVNRNKEYAMPI